MITFGDHDDTSDDHNGFGDHYETTVGGYYGSGDNGIYFAGESTVVTTMFEVLFILLLVIR